MRIWIDAQMSPALAGWLSQTFGMEAIALRDLGLRDSEDEVIFTAARDAGAVVLSKDRDFVELLNRLGPPPQVVWITSGNTSNARMREILASALPQALELIRGGESLVEVSDVHGRSSNA